MKIRIEFEQSEQREAMDLFEEFSEGTNDLDRELLKRKVETFSKSGNLQAVSDPEKGVYEIAIGSKITNFIISKLRPIVSAAKTLILLIMSFVDEVEDVLDEEETDTTVDGVDYYTFSSNYYQNKVNMCNDLAAEQAKKAAEAAEEAAKKAAEENAEEQA